MAASSGSTPALINSIAFSTARSPFADEITIGLFAPTGPGGDAPRAVAPRPAAALTVMNVRRFRLLGIIGGSVTSDYRKSRRTDFTAFPAHRSRCSPRGILQRPS